MGTGAGFHKSTLQLLTQTKVQSEVVNCMVEGWRLILVGSFQAGCSSGLGSRFHFSLMLQQCTVVARYTLGLTGQLSLNPEYLIERNKSSPSIFNSKWLNCKRIIWIFHTTQIHFKPEVGLAPAIGYQHCLVCLTITICKNNSLDKCSLIQQVHSFPIPSLLVWPGKMLAQSIDGQLSCSLSCTATNSSNNYCTSEEVFQATVYKLSRPLKVHTQIFFLIIRILVS